MNDFRLRLSETAVDALPLAHPPIGRLLVERGKIAPGDLQHALNLQRRIDAPLGDIMVSEGLVHRHDLLAALATQACTEAADLDRDPPLTAMADRLPVDLCLRFDVVPWRAEKDRLYVATASPAGFTSLCAHLGPSTQDLMPVIVEEQQIRTQLGRLYGATLALRANKRVPAQESCRGWDGRAMARTRYALGILGLLAAVLLFAPAVGIVALALLATVTLLMTTALKLAAFAVHLSDRTPKAPRIARALAPALRRLRTLMRRRSSAPELEAVPEGRADAALRIVAGLRAFPGGALPSINVGERPFRLPRVSVLVPLLHEREIAGQLIDRLSQLTYPKSLLQVVLVLEQGDHLTRDTIARTDLPHWMSVIEVPGADQLTTKPRALNYALDFCKGSVIGVWDAEDWPATDQIETVVTRFHSAPPDVVCLQGVLDYYNSRATWLARCFTIEYAVWWRLILPGIARLGLVVPLGGTTLFFRRKQLEELGGWDAHNVTEDADLGLRLARHGYRTELLPTVTREEATSRAWPWVRQRSRWLKGFLITYFVHMRAPRQLLRDLGPLRFFGVQTLFLATVAQFALAPVLWSFWLILSGMGHPATSLLGAPVLWSMIGLFVFAELLNLAMGLAATATRSHRHLIAFLPTMPLYFVLGTLAAYKALWELVRVPFYWDKTQHGVTAQTDPMPAASTCRTIPGPDQASS